MRDATATTFNRGFGTDSVSGGSYIFGATRVWIYALAPALVSMVVFSNTLTNSFAFDDEWMILKNPFIHSLRNLPQVMTTNPWTVTDDASVTGFPYFRPALAGLFVVSYRVFGRTAWGYHLINILIHACVTLLVFLVVKEVSSRLGIAAFCSLLFAVHPVHVEPVAWISAAPELLMSLFALTAFWLYLKYRKTGCTLFLALTSVLYFLALLSKETALALPLVVICCELVRSNDSLPRRGLMRFLAIGSLFAIPTAAYFVLRYNANGSFFLTYEPNFSWHHAILTVPLVAVKYLALLIVPLSYRIHHYTEPVETVASIAFVAPLLILIALALVIRLIRSRVLYFSTVWLAVWMVVPLAALATLLPVYFVQERYLYLPSAAFCLAIAFGLDRLVADRRRGRFVAAVVGVLLVVVWGLVSIRQNRVWNNSITLFEHNVAVDARSPEAHAALALEYFFQRRQAEAEREAIAALELDPNCINGHIALSYMAENTGNLDQAIEHLERLVSRVSERPTNRYVLASVQTKLGWLYAGRKDFVRAEQGLQRATRMVSNPQAAFELARFYLEQGRYDEARELLEETARQVSPRTASVHLQLGRVYDRLGQSERARAVFMKYLDLSPRGKAREEVISRLSHL